MTRWWWWRAGGGRRDHQQVVVTRWWQWRAGGGFHGYIQCVGQAKEEEALAASDNWVVLEDLGEEAENVMDRSAHK